MKQHEQSEWWLALGASAALSEKLAWQDAPFFVFGEAANVAERFVVAGNVWLSNRADLLRRVSSPTVREGSFRNAVLPYGRVTDTALVSHLWEAEGCACVTRLQGQFAFAVWDRQARECWLVRDAIGAQTLYYATHNDVHYAAPRLRTLAKRLSPTIDAVALRDYLCCAFVPGERTMWQGIRELRPGTILRLPAGERQQFWEISEQLDDDARPLDWHAQQLRAQLETVMDEYLPSDEPVGCYLSGGLDSSAIAALAKQRHRGAVHTYSIHFGDETPNELEFSSLVAAHCQTEHRIIEIKTEQMWSLLPETMAALDDPIGDPLTIPNLILGRAAKQSVNTILNGEGGDPCFGGPKNQPMLLNQLYAPALDQADDLLAAYLASFQKCSTDLPRLLRPEIWRAVKDEPSVFAPDLVSAESFLNRLMFINTRYKGADHILTKVSNLTEHCGLRGLSPLFDQRVVALSQTIPPEFKLSGAEEKAVLKAAVRDLLPARILQRPKSGMMVPVQLWFRAYWRKQARALLLHRRARVREFLNADLIEDWLNYRGDTWSRYGVKLWLLVSLEYWLQGA